MLLQVLGYPAALPGSRRRPRVRKPSRPTPKRRSHPTRPSRSLRKTPPAEAKPAAVEKGLWQTDFEAAKAKAKAEKKLLLVDFTGSDWCGWCIKLKQEVFDKETFKTEAPKQFVCVELDFPHNKELSKELKEQNAKLSDQYKVPGFPTVIVMDPKEK